jgi:hypothetical protein
MKLTRPILLAIIIVTAFAVMPAIANADTTNDGQYDVILSGHNVAPAALYVAYVDIKSASVYQDANGNYVFHMTFYGEVPTTPLLPANGKPAAYMRCQWRLFDPDGLIMRVQLNWNQERGWSARYGDALAPSPGHPWVFLDADKFSIVGDAVTVTITPPLQVNTDSAVRWNANAVMDNKPGLWYDCSDSAVTLGTPWFLWDGNDGGAWPPSS